VSLDAKIGLEKNTRKGHENLPVQPRFENSDSCVLHLENELVDCTGLGCKLSAISDLYAFAYQLLNFDKETRYQ
jgi:hypothetical protein